MPAQGLPCLPSGLCHVSSSLPSFLVDLCFQPKDAILFLFLFFFYELSLFV